jgi:hypothetical protein
MMDLAARHARLSRSGGPALRQAGLNDLFDGLPDLDQSAPAAGLGSKD